jgi:DNA-binding winged helix-turn-helix (wHTH) protein/TolB-like protein
VSYRIRFGPFDLDADARELRKNGMKVRLGGQPMQILLLLLRRPGEVVAREELRQALWPANATVDFDVGLSTALRKLREALRDSAESPRFIETLPRRGYRFIEPVSIDQPPSPPKRFDRRWIIAVAAAVIIAAASIVLLNRSAIRSVAVVPFENLTGDASQTTLANGVTNRLAASVGFRVIPRASTDVDMVVTGSVSKAGIFVQLIHTSDGQVVWARRYQNESRIAADIADAIRRAGGPPSPARRLRS